VGGWRRYLKLQAQAKTGLSYGPLVWGGLTLVFWALAFVWIIVSAFIWLAERYAPLVAALALTGFFLLTAVVALGYCLYLRRRTIAHAELELAACSGARQIDARLLGGAIQAGRAIGWRRGAPLLAVGVLAFGLGMHRLGRDKPPVERDDENGEREFVEAA
jgi:hypothetical protein